MPAGRPDAYPQEIREYVVTQALDHGQAIKPMVDALHRGELEDFGKVPVNYSTARGWVERERQNRDRSAPLDAANLDAYLTRLWVVAGRELRKLERDAAKTKPLDLKRLNELETFAARMQRRITKDTAPDTAQPPVAQDHDQPASMLERLAAAEANPPSDDAPRHISPVDRQETPEPRPTSAVDLEPEPEPTTEEQGASPVHIAA